MTPEEIKETPANITRLVDIAQQQEKAASEYSSEGNKYEFETCDLLIKGAGAGFFLYFTLIQIKKAEIFAEPIILLSLSLLFGVWHKLGWARKLLRLGNRFARLHAKIMIDTHYAVTNQQPKEGSLTQNLLNEIMSEQKTYFESLQSKKQIRDGGFKYVVPSKSYSQWPIFLQIVMIIFAILSVFGIFSICQFASFLLSKLY